MRKATILIEILIKLQTWNVHPSTLNLHLCGFRGHCGSCSVICISSYNRNCHCKSTSLQCLHQMIYWMKQELSYRKQITRQLRTQYVEGIYRPNYPVTLKSRLRVTQGHCKWNHWTNHTRLSSNRVIWRWILSWPWNMGQSRSLKMVPFETWGAVSYSPSIVTMAVSLAISEIFSVKEWPDLEIWVWSRSRSLKMAGFDRPCMTFY